MNMILRYRSTASIRSSNAKTRSQCEESCVCVFSGELVTVSEPSDGASCQHVGWEDGILELHQTRAILFRSFWGLHIFEDPTKLYNVIMDGYTRQGGMS